MNLKDLKDTDKQILRILIEDSSTSHKEIAEKIKITRQTVSQRIKKLEDRVIDSFSIKIDFKKFEETQTKAYILFREDPDEKIRKKNEELIQKMPQIAEFSRLFGSYAGFLKVIVKNNETLTELVKKIQNLDGIKETETMIVHTKIKDDEMAPILHLLE